VAVLGALVLLEPLLALRVLAVQALQPRLLGSKRTTLAVVAGVVRWAVRGVSAVGVLAVQAAGLPALQEPQIPEGALARVRAVMALVRLAAQAWSS